MSLTTEKSSLRWSSGIRAQTSRSSWRAASIRSPRTIPSSTGSASPGGPKRAASRHRSFDTSGASPSSRHRLPREEVFFSPISSSSRSRQSSSTPALSSSPATKPKWLTSSR